MNIGAMVARLNELDDRVCGVYALPRSSDATTLDEAIAMSRATTDRLFSGERRLGKEIASPVALKVLTEFLQAQIEARQKKRPQPPRRAAFVDYRNTSDEEGRVPAAARP